MTEILKFLELPRYAKRIYLDENADCSDLKTLQTYFHRLEQELITSSEQLESWILKRSELEAAFDQAGSFLYIAMTCQTDDSAKSQAYQDFVKDVIPAVQPLDDALNRKFLADYEKYPLDEERYGLYVKAIRVGIDLYRSENISLLTDISLLAQDYQSVSGAMTAEFEGKEQTMPQLGKYLQEPDRKTRESVWRVMTQRRLQDKDKMEQLFDRMLGLRHQVAQNAGFENFMDYKFKSLQRFDYTPNDCRAYHQSVEELVVPLWNRILRRRREEMNVDVLRPWDLSVDPLGREPLKPFVDSARLIEGCSRMFSQVDTDLGEQFVRMANSGCLDLDNRKGKAPGGYQSALAEARKPFIFMNSVGVDSDIWTLLHEGGHAFHVNATADIAIHDYRHAPMEFCEVASMAMEMLGMDHLGEFYSEAEAQRSRRTHLEGIVWTLQWVATIDAFQQWIYLNPKHSADERRDEWLRVRARFGGSVVDWGGLDEEFAYGWHQQLHIFEVPFYYIEYAIAQLGALQVWRNARQDLPRAVAQYRQALALGGSVPLPRLFESAGIRFDFSREAIAPLVDDLQTALEL